MECPHCNSEIEGNTSLCPICHGNLKVQIIDLSHVTNIAQEMKVENDYEIFDENEIFIEKKEKHDLVFILMVVLSLVGLIAVGVVLYIYLFPTKTQNVKVLTTTSSVREVSKNEGVGSSIYNPGSLGEKMIASFKDSANNKTTNVDIVINRRIEGIELNELVNSYGNDATLIDGNNWYGYEYTIYFNDLTYLTSDIDPTINTTAYDELGNDFYLISGEKYVKFYSKNIYTGEKIGNEKSATIKAIYYLPNKDLSICFGERNKSLACIKK